MTPAELLAIEQRHDDEDIRANDIDALIAEVRRLQAEVDKREADFRDLLADWNGLQDVSTKLVGQLTLAKATALPPGHVAVPRQLCERTVNAMPGSFIADELRALLEGR